jgi:hypothetical protein
MSGLFSSPSAPTVPAAPPPAPTAANTQGEGDVAAREQALKMQRGRSATLLTGGSGLSDMGTTSKTLLGQ